MHRKWLVFPLVFLCYWLKKFATLSQPMRSNTKTNPKLHACIFLCLVLDECNYIKFWLVHCTICIPCDWSKQLQSTESHSKIIRTKQRNSHFFTLNFGKIKCCWVERLWHTLHFLWLSSLVESHFIQLHVRKEKKFKL